MIISAEAESAEAGAAEAGAAEAGAAEAGAAVGGAAVASDIDPRQNLSDSFIVLKGFSGCV